MSPFFVMAPSYSKPGKIARQAIARARGSLSKRREAGGPDFGRRKSREVGTGGAEASQEKETRQRPAGQRMTSAWGREPAKTAAANKAPPEPEAPGALEG